MRYVKDLLVLSIVLMGLLAVTPRRAFACDCLFRGSPKTAWEWSSAVFSGKVVRLDSTRRPITPGSTIISGAFKITLQVISIWKGLSSSELVFYASDSSSSCGYNFQFGYKYLVYAYKVGDELVTDNCTRTRLLSEAREDLQVLGAGQPPSASPQMVAVLPTETPPTTVTCPTWVFFLVAGLAIVLRYLTRNANARNSLVGTEVDSPDYYR